MSYDECTTVPCKINNAGNWVQGWGGSGCNMGTPCTIFATFPINLNTILNKKLLKK